MFNIVYNFKSKSLIFIKAYVFIKIKKIFKQINFMRNCTIMSQL